jgi:Flp pilus assembly pilin Flp
MSRRLSSRFWSDQTGQAAVEYVLLLAAFGIPMIVIVRWLLGALGGYYGMVMFFETLPFP